MDWNNGDKSTLPSMEYNDNPDELIVQLINRLTDLEVINSQFEVRIRTLENRIQVLESRINT